MSTQKAKLNAGYLGVDWVEDVTYRSKGPNGDVSQPSIHAIRYAVSRKEVIESGGYFTMSDVIWEMPVEALLFTPREEGDVIEASDATRWSILSVQKIDFDRTWQFVGRKER